MAYNRMTGISQFSFDRLNTRGKTMQEVKTIYQDVSTQVKCDLGDAALNGWLSDNWRIESVTNGMTQDDAGMYRAVLLVRERAQTEEEIFALWEKIDAPVETPRKWNVGDTVWYSVNGTSYEGEIIGFPHNFTPDDDYWIVQFVGKSLPTQNLTGEKLSAIPL